MGKIMYECPVCKTHNPDDAKNCYKCGHWMLSTTYPPKLVRKKSSIGRVLGIVALAITGAVVLFFIFIVVLVAILNDSSERTPQTVQQTTAGDTIRREALGERSNPIPLGTTQQLSVQQYVALTGFNRKNFNLSITINKSVRGPEAMDIIKEWNEYNLDPGQGFEYLLVNMTVSVNESESGDPISINQNTFSLVSGNGVKYDLAIVLGSNDDIYKELYEGAEHTGWAVFKVKTDDEKPLIEIVGKWFSL